MSPMRASSRSMLMRVSARASGPPGQAWGPRPKARCSLAFARSIWNSAGSVEAAGVAVRRRR